MRREWQIYAREYKEGVPPRAEEGKFIRGCTSDIFFNLRIFLFFFFIGYITLFSVLYWKFFFFLF